MPSMNAAAMSAGQSPRTTKFTHPCWALNATVCIAANVTIKDNPNVIPTPPYTNASYQQYPEAGISIVFDVYSMKNLIIMWGGTSDIAKYTGLTSYLYLSVTDVEWNGVPWFWVGDGTVWHANAGADWAPTTFSHINETVSNMVYNPAIPLPTNVSNSATCTPVTSTGLDQCSMYAKYLYSLSITGTVGSSPNFPNGAYVQWNATSITYGGSNGDNIYSNGTSKMFGGMFSYYVKDAWYWSSAGTSSGCPAGQLYQACYPDAPSSASCPDSGIPFSAAAFRCNLNVIMDPAGQVSLGGNVIVTLQANKTWQIYSGAEIDGATLNLLAYYPNGTLMQTWAAPFIPAGGSYPTMNCTANIPKEFFLSAYGEVVWNISAYDQSDNSITSQDYTDVTGTTGIFPSSNFSLDLNLTTTPVIIGQEGFNGSMANGLLPGESTEQQINVTITTINASTSVQAAQLRILVVFSSNSGFTEPSVDSMTRITQTHYYILIPALPAGANVTFSVKAWDYNDSTVTSHNYRYFVPTIQLSPNPALGFFYVKVLDSATGQYVTGANVTIVGEGGAIDIVTKTMAGLAYPNASGKQFTPQFLPANNTYAVIVQWDGFQAADRPTGTDSLRISFFLYHNMTGTQTILSGPNYFVQQQGDIFLFDLNVPTPPPTFSNSLPPNDQYLTEGIGLAIASAIVVPVYFMWRDMRKRAEEEEKRITL